MIRNGRPYTDENGSIDAALITEHHSKEEIEIVCCELPVILPPKEKRTK